MSYDTKRERYQDKLGRGTEMRLQTLKLDASNNQHSDEQMFPEA